MSFDTNKKHNYCRRKNVFEHNFFCKVYIYIKSLSVEEISNLCFIFVTQNRLGYKESSFIKINLFIKY